MSPTRGTRAQWLAGVAVALFVAGVSVFAYYLIHALSVTTANTARIEANAWRSCRDLNVGFARQNTVIDQAIRREMAKAHPDPKALDALHRFRLPIRDCGAQPPGVR